MFYAVDQFFMTKRSKYPEPHRQWTIMQRNVANVMLCKYNQKHKMKQKCPENAKVD